MISFFESVLFFTYIAMAVSAVILLSLFGRDEKPIITERNCPPDGITPAEAGYAIDGAVSYRDVLALLPYWAEKGYLAFEEENGFFSLKKNKELDAFARPYERYFFGEIFLGGDTRAAEEFACRFRPVLNKTRQMVTRYCQTESPYFTKRSKLLQPILTAGACVPMLSMLFLSLARGMSNIAFALFASALLAVFLLNPVLDLIRLIGRWRGNPPKTRTISLLWLLTLFLLLAAGFLLCSTSVVPPLVSCTSILSTTVIGLCAAFIGKRTAYGQDLLCQAEGLKMFIAQAQSDALEALAQENSRYYYHILPYAYLFDLCEPWGRNFDLISVEPPHWYNGCPSSLYFTPAGFTECVNRAMSVFAEKMVVMSGKYSG